MLSFNYAPLHFAVQHRFIDIIKLLLTNKDIDVNCQTINQQCIYDILLCSLIAFETKSNVYLVFSLNWTYYTPLHIAAQKGSFDIVEILLERDDIDINSKTI